MEQVSDKSFLEEWRAGSNAAGSALLQQNYEAVARFFRNKVGACAVDDLVQETFEVALNAREQYEGRSSFRVYVLGIARFRLYQYYRSRVRDADAVNIDDISVFDLSPSPGTWASEREERAQLLEALRRLPIHLQVILELHYWEDLSGSELGEVLSIPTDTAYSRLRKAKQTLKSVLAELGSHSSEADVCR